MATEKNKIIMDFLDENPQIKGSCYGGQNANISRINDGWYEQTTYWFKSNVIIEYINKLKEIIPKDEFIKNFPDNERIGW